ncbi:helix-turn-helix domain-containing protein [Novosphingobium sp. G106]|uniref:helix-turn-helix domain-containing protein n=1 Tax=Novosphingobium sp. G106 TaxID=2849500 RepID=UPI0035C86ACA
MGITILDDDGHVRTLDEIEADLIHLALSIYGGCVAEAARGLGIGRSTLYRKLESQGMSPS